METGLIWSQDLLGDYGASNVYGARQILGDLGAMGVSGWNVGVISFWDRTK